jgi:hypothetical protein
MAALAGCSLPAACLSCCLIYCMVTGLPLPLPLLIAKQLLVVMPLIGMQNHDHILLAGT